MELKKAWYGDKDSDEKELTPTQLKYFIKLYCTQSKKLKEQNQNLDNTKSKEQQVIDAIKKEVINKTLKNIKQKEIER
ncbi:Uncharacterised protein [Campylobacter geochelonis]|nr:Uncharacterised protein [Campylobacter geochelonis]